MIKRAGQTREPRCRVHSSDISRCDWKQPFVPTVRSSVFSAHTWRYTGEIIWLPTPCSKVEAADGGTIIRKYQLISMNLRKQESMSALWLNLPTSFAFFSSVFPPSSLSSPCHISSPPTYFPWFFLPTSSLSNSCYLPFLSWHIQRVQDELTYTCTCTYTGSNQAITYDGHTIRKTARDLTPTGRTSKKGLSKSVGVKSRTTGNLLPTGSLISNLAFRFFLSTTSCPWSDRESRVCLFQRLYLSASVYPVFPFLWLMPDGFCLLLIMPDCQCAIVFFSLVLYIFLLMGLSMHCYRIACLRLFACFRVCIITPV